MLHLMFSFPTFVMCAGILHDVTVMVVPTGCSTSGSVCWLCCFEQPKPEAEHHRLLSDLQDLHHADTHWH